MRPHRSDDDPLLVTDLHVEATYRLTEALVESENRMRRRLELLSEVIFETDSAGRLVFLNSAWTRVTGCAPEACLGRPLSDFVAKEDWPLCARALEGHSRTASAAPTLIRICRPNGGTAWMEMSVAPIGGGAVGALHDVTQRKLAQDELAKLSLVASNTDNMVVITDREGRTEWVNDAFTRRTGYTLEDLSGRKPGELLQGTETDRETVAQIRANVRNGCSFRAELLNYTKQGEPYWVQFQITPIRNAEGEVDRFVSIQTDMTELHRTQQALEAAKVNAEAASQAKTQFIATISHEMRTPLSAILGSIDLALADEADAPALRPHLTRISDAAELLQRLISDVLDVAKIEAGQIDIERVPMRIRPCLQSAVAAIADRARAKNLDFELMVDESLPVAMLGDPDRVRQIVTNLAENAVKFTDTGYVRVGASRAASGEAGQAALEIRVLDSGVGIPPEAHRRIFERFVQGDGSTTRRKGGAGLGLSIVKSLVEALGGAVRVHSRAGAGADFQVTLPLVPIAAPSRVPVKAPAGYANERPGAAVSPTRILVAEDNDMNFAVFRSCLKMAGYAVERALDGREAIAAASRCDLILMDVEMPEMDGLEATRHIRAAERERGVATLPILALTAHALQEYRDRCLAAGCTSYLSKPVRPHVLLDAVDAALDDARSTGRAARDSVAAV